MVNSRNRMAMLLTMPHRQLLEEMAKMDDYDDSPHCSGYEHVYFEWLRFRDCGFYDTLSAYNAAQLNALFLGSKQR
jgi:hypothetical protein